MNRAPEKPGEKRVWNECVFGERNFTIKLGKGMIWKRIKTKRAENKYLGHFNVNDISSLFRGFSLMRT